MEDDKPKRGRCVTDCDKRSEVTVGKGEVEGEVKRDKMGLND
jgi:hypothetical protein